MRRSAVVLAAGAGVYAMLQGPFGLTFDATPLLVGVIVLSAATTGGARRLAASGLVLVGWGATVVLVRHGPLPDEREAAAFLVGAGLGLVAARLVSGSADRPLGDGSTAVVAGGAAFYLAFEWSWLGQWPVWVVVLLVWAGWELARPPRRV
ncbi:MAG: hypothetical protein ACRD2W_09840 [Acidimicrobiales bacterium]